MAYSDFLRNIKQWINGNFKSVEFYKRLNEQCFNVDLGTMHIPLLTPVRFHSCFIGEYDANTTPYASNALAVEDYTPQSGYNTSITMGALSPSNLSADSAQNGAGAFNRLLKKELENYSGIIAYVEIAPASELLSGTQKFARCIGVAGMGTKREYIDVFEHINWIGCASPYALCYYDETSHRATSYKEDNSISSLFYIKNVRYFIEREGERIEIEGCSPVYPFLVSNTKSAKRVIDGTNYSMAIKQYTAPSEGVGEFTLPCFHARAGTSRPTSAMLRGTGATQFNRSNWGNPNFDDSPSAGILSWLMDTVNISKGAVVNYTNNNGSSLWNIGKCPYIVSPFNFVFAKRFTPTTSVEQAGNVLATDTGAYYACADGNVFPLVATFDTVKALFEDWGIFATDNLDEALYGEIPMIVPESPAGGDSGNDPDLPPSGITGNDIPELIPSNPDNIIDDFVVETPNISPANLCNSYVYNITQVRELFNWFCSEGYIKNQSELFADKLSAIYGLMMFPFDLVTHDPNHVTPTSSTTIVSVSENISGYILGEGYDTIIEGGEITYLSYYGNFADWSNCKYSVYIPYSGVVEIPPATVVNRRLKLQYGIDLLTGKATAILKSYSLNSDNLGVLVKLIPCQIGHSVPVQSSNFAQREISNTLSAISIGTTALSAATGNIGSLINFGQQLVQYQFAQQLSYCASGSLSPTTGFQIAQAPYLSISRGHLVTPTKNQEMNGLPTAHYTQLAAVSTGGNFVQCQNVYIDVPNGTNEEINEIRSLLETGVYI